MPDAITVTNRDLPRLQRGLKALDGHAGKDGPVRFDFGPNLVWDSAIAASHVERATETFDRAKKSVANQNGVVDGQRLTDENAPKVAKYLEEVEALKDKTVELPIVRLSRKDLQKGGLNLPNVFADLMPILEDK